VLYSIAMAKEAVHHPLIAPSLDADSTGQTRVSRRCSPLAVVILLLIIPILVTFAPGAVARLSWFVFPSFSARTPKLHACAPFKYKIGSPRRSNSLPNFREVTVVSVSWMGTTLSPKAFDARVYRATGRRFVVAPQDALKIASMRVCLYQIAHKVLGVNRNHASQLPELNEDVSKVITPEPAFLERRVENELRLPGAASYLSRGLGKLYVDIPAGEKAVNSAINNDPPEDGTRPLMSESAQAIWKRVARATFRTGSHLDWGTGSSSHFACGEYASVKAIDSQPSWCTKTQASVGESQKHCGNIEMNCVDVGPLATFGHPIANKTSGKYFDKYVNAVERFATPYYDSILVDGRFRTACAVKALTYLRADSFLLVHDYLPDSRAAYTRLVKYFTLLANEGSLAVFQPRQDLNESSLLDYSQYPEALR
jgi:hypothetical protein